MYKIFMQSLTLFLSILNKELKNFVVNVSYAPKIAFSNVALIFDVSLIRNK